MHFEEDNICLLKSYVDVTARTPGLHAVYIGAGRSGDEQFFVGISKRCMENAELNLIFLSQNRVRVLSHDLS